jgi:hypothetical protein
MMCHGATEAAFIGGNWNSDWRCTGLRITTRWDFFQPRVVCNSCKTERKGGGGVARWCRGQTIVENTIVENIIKY